MLRTVKDMTVQDVLPILNQRRTAIQANLDEVREDAGGNIIDIDVDDLHLLEAYGYLVDLENGRILAGPEVLVL